jgi:hypothetical protein
VLVTSPTKISTPARGQYPVTDLSQGGKAFGQGPAIEKGLLERAEKKITIQQNPDVH